ncbi:hypothetical protein [Emticicia sp. BO119]|uniref:hypothetical protein n=1 Tax=Emticicia sp. BO119 TaxID=2757768 RepID=UPI0015F081DB|nr:hypothetical protein [Emticicia sp. BO119]MBA4851227.1 hypothetical protein [Emticicia sp. BO119]
MLSILFFSSFYVVLAQENLSIHLLNVPESISANTHFTLFFEVESTNPLVDSVYTRLIIPDGWQTLIARNPQQTIRHLSIKYIYTLATAPTAPSGNYPVTLCVYHKDMLKVQKTVTIRVKQERKIEVTPIFVPDYVMEGDSLNIEYLIQNKGNNPEKVWIDSPKRKTSQKLDSLTLLPGENIRISKSQKVPVGDGNSWTISPKLCVFMRDSANPVTQILSVQVYSKKNKKNDPYLRFPIEVGMAYSRFSGSNYIAGSYQYDARGRGFLDFKQHHYADFVIHGPDQSNIQFISGYSQYSLAYRYKKNTVVQAGDYSLTFNHLMEFGRFGRGLKIDGDYTRTGFSVFYLQPRFFPDQKATYGGSLTYKFQNKFRVSASYLSKNIFTNKQWAWARFAGVTLQLKTNLLSSETEIALSSAHKKTDFGAFNRFGFHYKKFQLNNNLIYAGKNFLGFYNNSWALVNSVNYHLSKKIYFGIVSNVTRVNPNFDVLVLKTSPYYSSHTAMVSYAFHTQHRIMLSYHQQTKEDRQPQKQFHYRENYTRIGYYINTPTFNLLYDARYGFSENLLQKSDNNPRARSFSNLIQPQIQVFPSCWLSILAEHQHTNKFSKDNQLKNYVFYGGSIRVHLKKYVDASFMYRNSYAPDELVERQSFMDLAVNCTIGNHKLSLTGGRVFVPTYTQTNQNTLFFLLKYTLTLNTPLAKNRNLGHIRGQISGLSESVRKEGILIQLGNRKYVSDANGFFYFNDLVPDKYYLTLDKSSLGTGAVAAIRTPIEVNVSADSTRLITIPLIKSGSIEGSLNFATTTEDEKTKKQIPVILLKIYNDTESYLTKANDKNNFSFKELKPGIWTIKAWFPDNQNQFTIQNPEQSIQIEEGVANKIAFNVLAVQRKIHFSNKSYQVVLQQ